MVLAMTISLKNAVGDFFETEEKWMTLLLLSLCQLIPIVGPMVLIGYFTRRFALKRSGAEAPDFKFDDFAEYLQIGLWPTLAYLVLSLFFIPLMILAEIPMFVTIIKIGPEPESLAPMFIAMAVTYGLIILASLLLLFIASPVVLRSSLMKSFKDGFSKRFVFSFIKKVGLSFLLWTVLLWVLAIFASMLGMCAFFVGSIFVGTIAMYAGFHLLYQHYDLYLERGGEEIEIHPEVLEKAVRVPPIPQTGGKE